MSDDQLPRFAPPDDPPGGVVVPLRPSDRKELDERRRRRLLRESRRRRPPKVIRWRRILLLLIPIGILALTSMVFGFFLAVAADLPPLTKFLVNRNSENSVILDDAGHPIAVMTDAEKPGYYVPASEIPELMKRAIIAIEDKRFYTEPGVDVLGVARAAIEDLTGSGTTQGASTITEQLVKQIRNAQYKRTFLEKLVEAGIAFQLAHKYANDKDVILAAYLNDTYYGNGAWGIEAAAQTYFGNDPTSSLYGCGYDLSNPANLCIQKLTVADAALLASLVQHPPSNWDDTPLVQGYFLNRRNTDLLDMYNQGYISQAEYQQAVATPLPQQQYVIPPSEQLRNPGYGYFTSWVEQQVLDDSTQLPNPYTSGYHIHTTLDEPLQNEAQRIIDQVLPPGPGSLEASLVAINNQTGGVMAMVGGYDYNARQFNLATQAERQPGSAWKAFELAKALELGISPNHVYRSGPWTYRGGPGPPFPIRNDEADYAGHRTLFQALAQSDNTIFAQVGLGDGPNPRAALNNVARYAHDFGITTDVSRNPAMTIGGLYTGVTTLDMTHAYSTVARGNLISGTLASKACAGGIPVPTNKSLVVSEAVWPKNSCPGPVGITLVTNAQHKLIKGGVNEPRYYYIPGFTAYEDLEERAMMRAVVTEGTGGAANIPNFVVYGKTGTTSNYHDAWWCGFTQQMTDLPDGITVCVWVGYDNENKSMKYAYNGKPVYGGTYPAVIFKTFVQNAIGITQQEYQDRLHHRPERALILETLSNAPISYSLPSYGSSSSTTTTTPPPSTGTTSTGATATGGATQTPTTPTGATTTPGTNTGTPATPPASGPGGGAAAPGG
jgi:penicillin-binding protein 1A